MKSVGKPDALIGHVRFDERGRETGQLVKPHATAPFLDSTLSRGAKAGNRLQKFRLFTQLQIVTPHIRIGVPQFRSPSSSALGLTAAKPIPRFWRLERAPLATPRERGRATLFDHLVGACEERWRHFESQRLRGLQVMTT